MASPGKSPFKARSNLSAASLKSYGACQAGMKGIIIPKENSHDIPERHLGLDIHYAADIDDVLKLMLVKQGES